jgi:ATP-grasp domain
MGFVQGVDTVYGYSAADPVKSLATALRRTNPDIVIPCDERAVAQLHELHTKYEEWRALVERSLGNPRAFATVRSRGSLMGVARQCGLLIPESRDIRSREDLRLWFAEFPGRAVLKLDGSWGGNGVEFVGSYPEAVQVFENMAGPMSFGKALKRFLVNRDRVAFWEFERSEPVVSIQTYIPGRPANSMLVCREGKLHGQVSVEVLETQGKRGASTVVRVIENEDMTRAAGLLTKRLSLSGFHGLDFMIEEGTQRAYLIELNPRCTQLGHLSLSDAGDLAAILCSRLTGEPVPGRHPGIISDIIVFFPQALAWNPNCTYLRTGYHDVPSEEPELIAELLKAPWPERQWRARLYDSLFARESLDLEPNVTLTQTTGPSRTL